MKKILLLACSLMLSATIINAQKFMDIKFENGTLVTSENFGCSLSRAHDNQTSKTGTSSSKAGIPQQAVYNADGAMLKVSKEGDDWFMEVPDSILGRYILTITRFTATPAGLGTYGGEEAREQTLYFEMTPAKDNLMLRARIQFMQADTTETIYQAVKNSNSDPIVASFKIENKAKETYKIKITSFILSDNILSLDQATKRSFGCSGLNGNLSYVESVHSYPINTEVRVVRTFNSNNSSAPTMTFGLNTSFLLLPKEPMQQRIFDPRVGFFTDGYYKYSDNQQQVERDVFVTRRRLEPKSEEDAQRQRNGELIEPKKQIVYYIDPATPKQWRPYLIQGVKDWNAAFEKAGWKNAITALECPEDSTISMEDARYSFIMYLASDIANAYGPQNHDPRSGEILESHVGWYHNVMTLVHDWYQVQCAAVDPEARKAKFSEELMGELIRFVSSHEIGHTLGLRHNFGSSSTVPVDSLRSNAFLTKWGHTPSIMDYARFNYVAQPEDGVEVKNLFPRINDYDKWAIEWAYKPNYEASNAETDRYLLNIETTKRLNADRRLWWGDGEGYRNDPRCQTEDLGDNNMKANALGIENLKRIIPNLREWNYWGSDTYDQNITTMYNQVVNQYLRYCTHVSRNLVGTYHNALSPDQPGKIYEYPSKEKAEQVIPFLAEQVFEEPSWLVDVPYANRVFADRDATLESVASKIVAQLVQGGLISQVTPTYGSVQYLKDLTKAIFKDFNTSAPLTRYQRYIQSTYVSGLCKTYTASRDGVANDALAAVFATLKDIDKKFRNVSNADPLTKAHYDQLSDQIQRALIIK